MNLVAHRVFDSPLAEGGIAAIAMGMGLNGLDLLLKYNLLIIYSRHTTKSSMKLPNYVTVLVASFQHLYV